MSRCATVDALRRCKLALGFQFFDGLLIGALRFLDLSVSGFELDLRLLHRGIDLGDPPPCRFESCFLLRAVELEDRLPRLHLVANIYIDLLDATASLRQKRHGTEERDGVLGRWMIVEDQRDQEHRQDQAGDDPPAQLEPDRIKRDLVAEPPPLCIAAEQVVGQYGNHRAQEELKHH